MNVQRLIKELEGIIKFHVPSTSEDRDIALKTLEELKKAVSK